MSNTARNTSLIEISAYSEDPPGGGGYRQCHRGCLQELADQRATARLQREVSRRWRRNGKNRTTLVKAQQAKVDKMKNDFGISDWEAQYGYSMSTVEPETLRKLEGLRIEAQAEHASHQHSL